MRTRCAEEESVRAVQRKRADRTGEFDMCGRYYVDDDTAGEIEKVIRQVNEKLRAQKAEHGEGAVAERKAEHGESTAAERTAGHDGKKESGPQEQESQGDRLPDLPSGGIFPSVPAPVIVPSGDIYPTVSAPVIGAGCGAGGCRIVECRMLRWGMPGFAPKESGKKGQIILNARSETAMEKPAFREAMRNHRIVIPAAGFYEWNRKKEKYRFHREDSPVLFMAGCFQHDEDGERFVILTTAANESMEPVHDRMPLILEPDEIAAWIWDGERTKSLLEKRPCLLERKTDYEQMTLF